MTATGAIYYKPLKLVITLALSLNCYFVYPILDIFIMSVSSNLIKIDMGDLILILSVILWYMVSAP